MDPLVIDSSALVGWWYHWYPPDSHDFWDALEQYAQVRRLLIPEEVYVELETFRDLYGWLDEHRTLLFCPNDHNIDAHVIHLVNKYKQKLKLMKHENNADLYVIATAALHGGYVVTDEREARRRREGGEVTGKYRIPNICRLENIERMHSYEVAKVAGWRFKLDQ